MQIILSAFALGLLSSFHCVGMCGAIAFSLPTQHLNNRGKVAGILLYNGGRIITYSSLGVIFGAVGRTIYLGGFQQWFSIIAGVLILLILVQSMLPTPVLHLPGFKKMNLFVQHLIGGFLRNPTFGGMLLLGMANGLLPCGLVYLALTGAVSTGSISDASAFMAAFGLGTMPAMFLLSYFGFLISIATRNTIKKAVPFAIALMGILLIARGLGLGIPWLSPAFTNHAAEIIDCH
ncbi:sulfite exporter TauE/SafE family protein [Segetibacter sp. 3557_3]|uniref:sulfite exporter TauE/SafE family protein n=1 Tax=Segetibacter sp. 3557_3 TaxID=2547429 RepID=UPI0014044F6E|nr:sulfite exporter TauE/SafE family protein [Segetibacter sp. 3557_3]